MAGRVDKVSRHKLYAEMSDTSWPYWRKGRWQRRLLRSVAKQAWSKFARFFLESAA